MKRKELIRELMNLQGSEFDYKEVAHLTKSEIVRSIIHAAKWYKNELEEL